MRSMSQFLPTGSFLWLGNTLSALGPDSPTLVARPRRRERSPGEQQKPSGKAAVPGRSQAGVYWNGRAWRDGGGTLTSAARRLWYWKPPREKNYYFIIIVIMIIAIIVKAR